MPSLAPADPASERALRASPLVPTLSFAALGLATMVAIGALGLAQHPAAAPDVASPGISVRPPQLSLAGVPAEARSATPEAASATPVALPGAGLLRAATPTEMVVPVVDSSARSAGRGSGARSATGSAQETAVAVGRGTRLTAGLPGQGAVAGSPGSANGADRPVAAARKRPTSPQPVPAPQRPKHTPVAGQPTTVPVPKASTPPAPLEDAGTPTPDGTSVVSGPSPVQGQLVMAAKPRMARVAVAQPTSTLAPPTPGPAKREKHQTRQQQTRQKHQPGVRQEPRQDAHGRQEAQAGQGHRPTQSRQVKHDDQDRRAKQDHRDHQAKQGSRAKQGKQGHAAKQRKQAKRQHRTGHGHGGADHR